MNARYRRWMFWVLLAEALWQSLALFFIPYFAYAGSDVGLWELGVVMAFAAVVVVNLHLALEISCWTWILAAVLGGSLALYFIISLGQSSWTLFVLG